MGWPDVELKCQSVHLLQFFWPQTASITMEVKNNHAHLTTQRILNKFIKINFSVGCMVWPWCCLFQDWLPVKILMRYFDLLAEECYFVSKIVLTNYIWEKIVLVIEKTLLKFEAKGQELANFLEITRTIYSKKEMSVQFLNQNALLTYSWRFLSFKILDQFEFKSEKNGI